MYPHQPYISFGSCKSAPKSILISSVAFAPHIYVTNTQTTICEDMWRNRSHLAVSAVLVMWAKNFKISQYLLKWPENVQLKLLAILHVQIQIINTIYIIKSHENTAGQMLWQGTAEETLLQTARLRHLSGREITTWCINTYSGHKNVSVRQSLVNHETSLYQTRRAVNVTCNVTTDYTSSPLIQKKKKKKRLLCLLIAPSPQTTRYILQWWKIHHLCNVSITIICR